MPLILIVDDDASFREALEGLLQSFGYDTQAFSSSREVLASSGLSSASCLILDVEMPVMDGLELYARLAATGLSKPVIFVTGSLDPRIRSRALAMGAVDVLTKPFDRDALMTRLQSISGPLRG